jgi:hypothetical protein
MSASDTIEEVDIFDGVVIVVPPEEHAKELARLRRGVPKRSDGRRTPELGLPLFMLVGLPAIAFVGVVIGYTLSVL